MSEDEISRMNAHLSQEPAQRDRAEQLFRGVLRTTGEFKNRVAENQMTISEIMVELEKLEEALLFFKGISNKYYDALYQMNQLLQDRKLSPAHALRLLEKKPVQKNVEAR
ncbi:MAG: hypothetical protein V3U98_05365 [Acidobacteriota bacterium]